MRTRSYFYQLGLFLLLWLGGLQLSAQSEMPVRPADNLTIAVSWERSPESYQYTKWLLESDSNIRTIVSLRV